MKHEGGETERSGLVLEDELLKDGPAPASELDRPEDPGEPGVSQLALHSLRSRQTVFGQFLDEGFGRPVGVLGGLELGVEPRPPASHRKAASAGESSKSMRRPPDPTGKEWTAN